MIGRMARVVVVEQMVLVAETFGIALGGAVDARVVVVSVGSSTCSIAREVLKARPDVVFIDCDLGPHVDCATLVEALVEHKLQVVVLTNRGDDDAALGEFLRRGAVGALCKSEGLSPIIVALRHALARQPVMDIDQATHLMAVAQDAKHPQVVARRRLSTLTAREREVLKELMTGATAPEIARSWCLSEVTVRTQIRSILSKLEVSSQLAAVATARRHGWTPTTTEAVYADKVEHRRD
jgi:DNA-binding NarL/FixJ family response regulator